MTDAATLDVAPATELEAAAAAPGPLFIDVPDPNRDGVELVTSHDFAPTFETARMYRGQGPIEPVERIFGVTTFELG